MSIFSGAFDALPWLQEKTLSALQSSVRLIDLANEPDTTDWYRRNLTTIAEHILEPLAPVVALLHGAGADAADREEWEPILTGGSFALATWCRKWKIADPVNMAKGSIKHLRTVEEDEAKAEEIMPESFSGDTQSALELKLEIYASMSQLLLGDLLSAQAQRMLLWMMRGLWFSSPPDVVGVSRKFLPTDIGVSNEEAAEAYKELFDKGLIERVAPESDEINSDRLQLRLVVQGVNDSRHTLAFVAEKFGFPGARIAGKSTSGQTLLIELPRTLSSIVGRWLKEPKELGDLRGFLQSRVGADAAYVERAEICHRSAGPRLELQFRYPLDAERQPIERQLKEFAEAWLKEKLLPA